MSAAVEVRVAASPTVEFALMLSTLYHSLGRFSGLKNWRMRVYLGAPRSHQSAVESFAGWLPPRVEAIAVDPQRFEQGSFHATAALRLSEPSDAKAILLMDADTQVCGSLRAACRLTVWRPKVRGVIAHVAPLSRHDWERIFTALEIAPEFPFRYNGWPYMLPNLALDKSIAEAPAYFNYGFMALTPALLERVAKHHPACIAMTEKLFPKTMFRSQIALTLAMRSANVPIAELPMRYNLPNDFRLEALHPQEVPKARVVHLLRRTQGLDKQIVFKNLANLREFAETSWRWAGAAAIAQRTVASLYPDIEATGVPNDLPETKWAW